jgi:polar amino acid transport system substrate-binding protein
MLFFIFLSFINFVYAKEQESCLEFHVISNAPIGFKNDKGKEQGVHWAYLAELEKSTGICINKTLLPYPRIWHSIEHGSHDGGIVFKSESRSSLVEYVALIRMVKTVVIPVKGRNIKSYDDLQNIIIGKTRGTHLSERFDNDEDLNVIELNSYGQAAQMLKHGRIDAIAGSALVLSFQLKKYGVLDKVDINNKLTLGEKEQWLQLSKKSTHLNKIVELKQAVEKLQKNNTFKLIMNKYYGQEWQQINK